MLLIAAHLSAGRADKPSHKASGLTRGGIFGAALLICLLGGRLSGQAQSPDRPLLLPSRDVGVAYQIDGARLNDAHKMQVTYAQGGERSRIDYFRWPEAEQPFMSMIFDQSRGHIITVMPESRSYLEQPIGTYGNPAAFLNPDMGFLRQGQETVAGRLCTDWNVDLPSKHVDVGVACITDDGIMLRLAFRNRPGSMMTATVIQYGAPPSGAFSPPADYTERRLR